MKKYIIEIIGCDATSDICIQLTEEQKSLIEKLSTITYAIRKREDSNCFPEMTIREWDGSQKVDDTFACDFDDKWLEYWRKHRQEEEARCVRCYGNGYYKNHNGEYITCFDCKGAGRKASGALPVN